MRISINVTSSTVYIIALVVLVGLATFLGLNFGKGMDPDSAGYAALGLETLGGPTAIFCTVCAVLALLWRRKKLAFVFAAPALFTGVFLFALDKFHF